MNNITFITAIFGERYMPFLLPHIYAIKEVYPDAKNLVYHSRINKRLLTFLQKFNNVELIEMETKDSSKHDSLNDRMVAWEMGAKRTEGRAVPIDVDIILIKPIDHFFKEDIVYTYRENHQFPLNLGILLLNNGSTAYEFMKELRISTYNTFHSPNMQAARDIYGSCDQKAMFDLHGAKKYKTNGVSCKLLNEVDCNLNDNTHALHYKTSWHSMILDGQPWNKNPVCQKAYDYWRQLNRQSKLFIQGNNLLLP